MTRKRRKNKKNVVESHFLSCHTYELRIDTMCLLDFFFDFFSTVCFLPHFSLYFLRTFCFHFFFFFQIKQQNFSLPMDFQSVLYALCVVLHVLRVLFYIAYSLPNSLYVRFSYSLIFSPSHE